jgi:hypothetical protein
MCHQTCFTIHVIIIRRAIEHHKTNDVHVIPENRCLIAIAYRTKSITIHEQGSKYQTQNKDQVYRPKSNHMHNRSDWISPYPFEF